MQSSDGRPVPEEVQAVGHTEEALLETSGASAEAQTSSVALLALALGFVSGWGLTPLSRAGERRRFWLTR